MRRIIVKLSIIVATLTIGVASRGGPLVVVDPNAKGFAQELTTTPSPAATETPLPSSSASPPAAPTPTPTAITPATATATETTTTATASVPTESATVTPLASVTPVPTPALPPLSDDPDAPDVATERTINASGGTIVTNDGRVAITFSSGAVDLPVNVRIVRPGQGEIASIPDKSFVGLWNFTATETISQNEVTSFNIAPTATLRFDEEDLIDVRPGSMQLWYWDTLASSWQLVPASATEADRITVVLPHFSTFAATGDVEDGLSPLSDMYDVNLQSGTLGFAIPIEVPVGPAGLSPNVALNYDSGGPTEMRGNGDVGSWSGIGWDLEVGSLRTDFDPSQPETAARYNLSLPGVVGGEIVPKGDGTYSQWFLRNGDYFRIEWLGGSSDSTPYDCDPAVSNCKWIVTDKRGTRYEFGVVSHFIQNTTNARKNYAWRLTTVSDTRGNDMRVTYTSVDFTRASGWHTYYHFPSAITWGVRTGAPMPTSNYYAIKFDIADDGDGTYTTDSLGQLVRRDTPWNNCGADVLEIRRLRWVRVVRANSAGVESTIRSYRLNYGMTPVTCPIAQGSPPGRLVLSSVDFFGRVGGNLRTMTFAYTDYYVLWPRPFLTTINNGFTGTATFTYEQAQSPQQGVSSPYGLDRRVVTRKRLSFGAGSGQPDVVTSYAYSEGPTKRFRLCSGCGSEYRGFGNVKEYFYDKDVPGATGDWAEHRYHTASSDWQNSQHLIQERLTGREFESWLRDKDCADPVPQGGCPTGTEWQHAVNTWAWRKSNLATTSADCLPASQLSPDEWLCGFFVHIDTNTTILRDGAQLREQHFFDAYGNEHQTAHDGEISNSNDDTTTNVTFVQNLTNWIFLPSVVERVDDGMPSNKKTSYSYYDGANSLTAAPTAGLLTASSTVLNTNATNNRSSTFSVFDTYGNLIQQSVPTFTTPESWAGARPASGWIPSGLAYDQFDYVGDPYHVLPTTHYPALQSPARSRQAVYDFDFQLAKDVTDQPSGFTASSEYDEFGRIVKSWDSILGSSQPLMEYSYIKGVNGSYAPFAIKTTKLISASPLGKRISITCYDGFGRAIAARDGASGGTVFSRTDYDSRGRTVATNNPQFATGGGAPGTADCFNPTYPGAVTTAGVSDHQLFEYDPLGNVTKTTFKNAAATLSAFSTADYNGRTETHVDENGHRTRRFRDIGNRTETVWLDTGVAPAFQDYAKTMYKYDRFQQLVEVDEFRSLSDPTAYNATKIQYDLAGRKLVMDDPDMGNWAYDYNAAGSLVSQRDARGITTTLTYDILERLLTKTYSNGDPQVELVYDVYPDTSLCTQTNSDVNRLTHMRVGTSPTYASQQLTCYDLKGRETSTRRLIAGDVTNYDISQTYNAANQVVNITYPDGEVVSHDMYNEGELRSLSSTTHGQMFAQNATYKPWGAVGSAQLGTSPAVTTTYGYDYRMRLTGIVTGTRQDVTLTYDNASNVTGVVDNTTSESSVYSYDDLNRLQTMTINGEPTPSAIYEYTSTGNLVRKKEGTSDIGLHYSFTKPHAASSVTGTETFPLWYDANGNLCAQVAYGGCPFKTDANAYSYDAENRLTSRPVGSAKTTYLYDGQGALLKRTNADGTWTTYIGGIYEKRSDGGVTKYYQGLGRTLAFRNNLPPPHAALETACTNGSDDDGDGVPDDGCPQLILSDHLGGTTELLNAAGNTVSEVKYWPYGSARSGAINQTDRLFTGQRVEQGDSSLGLYSYKARFFSAVLGRFASPDPLTSDGLNRYAYVRNSPLRFVDPSGLCVPGIDRKGPCRAEFEREFRREIARAEDFFEEAHHEGWTVLSAGQAEALYGASVAGMIVAVPRAGTSRLAAGLRLTAGFAVAFSAYEIASGNVPIDSLIARGGVVVANLTTRGENIRTGETQTVATAMSGWLADPTHFLHYNDFSGTSYAYANRELSSRTQSAVYFTKDPYPSGSAAQWGLGYVGPKVWNSVLLFRVSVTDMARVVGPRPFPLIYNEYQNTYKCCAPGNEYYAESPLPIVPEMIIPIPP